jgi:hypothetical protein
MAIDPYLPLEEHSVGELVEEIQRLNQVCFAHEQAREQLELKVAAFIEGELHAAEEAENDRYNGFMWGLITAAVGFFVLSLFLDL